MLKGLKTTTEQVEKDVQTDKQLVIDKPTQTETLNSDQSEETERNIENSKDSPDVNAGINISDMNISESIRNVRRFVEIDPKDYALTLTPQMKKDDVNMMDDVSQNHNLTDCSNALVRDVLIGQNDENKTPELIGDSDFEDVIEPSQSGERIIQCSENTFETYKGLKHKLSLPGKRKNLLGTTKETEVSCSAAKHLKFSRLDEEVEDSDRYGTSGNNWIQNQNIMNGSATQASSVNKDKNRIVARSGQKFVNASKRSEGGFSSSFELGTKTNAREMDITNLPKTALSLPTNNSDSNHSDMNQYDMTNLGNDRGMSCQSYILSSSSKSGSASFTTSTAQSLSNPMSRLSSESNAKQPGPSQATAMPQQRTIASSQFAFQYKPTTPLNAISNTPSLGSRTLSSGTSSSTSRPEISPPESTALSFRSRTTDIGSSSFTFDSSQATSVSLESSLASSENISGSSTCAVQTPRISNTDSSRSKTSTTAVPQQSELRTTPGDSEPSFLQKYREIVSKIKPATSSVQVRKCPKFSNTYSILLWLFMLLFHLIISGMANSVDPDQTAV